MLWPKRTEAYLKNVNIFVWTVFGSFMWKSNLWLRTLLFDLTFTSDMNCFLFSFRSDKRNPCTESISGKKNGKNPNTAVPPPIPMSPIVEKMEGLKAIRNRSNSLRLGRLAFYRHLEKVETMRSFWELKHVELEGGNQKVMCTDSKFLKQSACRRHTNKLTD